MQHIPMSPANPEDVALLEHVRSLVQGRLNASQSVASAVPLSKREVDGFSITRMIRSIVENDQSKAGFEREVSGAVYKALGKMQMNERSFCMPTFLPFQVKNAQRSVHFDRIGQRATYSVGTASAGGNLVQTQLMASDFIEVLRNATVTGQLGARFLPGLVGNVSVPRQTAQTATYWVGESTALTESETTFDQVQLAPKTVGVVSKISRLSLMQTTPTIEQLTRDDLLAAGALAVDAAIINGSGATGSAAQPRGIANTSGVGSVVMGANGGNATFDSLVQLYSAPLVGNAPQENLAFAINGKLKAYLSTLKSTTGQYLWNPSQSIAGAAPDSLVGYGYAVSNQLPATLTKGSAIGNCSMAIFGNWQEVLVGEWGAVEFAVNPFDSTGFTTGDVVVRMFHTIDVGVRHAASFAVCSDLLTPGF